MAIGTVTLSGVTWDDPEREGRGELDVREELSTALDNAHVLAGNPQMYKEKLI